MSNAIARRLDQIQKKGDLRFSEIAELLNSRAETVSRWNQGRAAPRADAEKLILELEYVLDLLADFYGPSDARLWLLSRQKALAGESPYDLIRRGKIDDVIAAVNRLCGGVHL
jgi:transcriptional regulator with XRE-family HTH domain